MSNIFEINNHTGERPKLSLLNPKLDFKLNPKKFIDWLVLAGECKDTEKDNPYSQLVGSMCEYSCLYALSILEKKKLKGTLQVCYGEFSCWGHYWLSYTLNDVEYFVDLTLAQFVPNADQLSITRRTESEHVMLYNSFDYIPIEKFMEYRRRDLEVIKKGVFKNFDPNTFLFGDKTELKINFDNLSIE